MNKEFIPYTEAFELKQIGFDEPCFAFWDAYNGGAHLFFERRVQYSWLISIFIKPPPVFECSQGLIEHEEGDNCILAPTYSQAFRWFRDVHNIDAWVQPFVMQLEINRIYLPDETYSYYIFKDGEFVSNEADFDEPEEAELDCLRKLIAIVKNK